MVQPASFGTDPSSKSCAAVVLSVATIISLALISPAEVINEPFLIALTVTPSRKSVICFAIAADSTPTPRLGKPGLPLMKVLMISNPAGAEMLSSSVR